jgi:hypothetical protein
MRVPLKLNSIEQEHLQELYNAAGVARDELPYSEKFEEIWSGFQDRTFKNAERDQLYGAIIKYVRSSSNASTEQPDSKLDDEQAKRLKSLLPRHAKGGKILPYSDEIDAARKEFVKLSGVEMTEQEFWQAIMRAQGPKRRPPKRAKVTAPAEEDESSSDDE